MQPQSRQLSMDPDDDEEYTGMPKLLPVEDDNEDGDDNNEDDNNEDDDNTNDENEDNSGPAGDYNGTADDANDPATVVIGNKRPRSPNALAAASQPLKKAVKLYASVNKPKAGDYHATARSLLKVAIRLFRGKLSTETPWVNGMLGMTWAKSSWMEGCKMYDSWTAYNTELVKLVRLVVYGWTVLIFIFRSQTGPLTSEAKSRPRSSPWSLLNTGSKLPRARRTTRLSTITSN